MITLEQARDGIGRQVIYRTNTVSDEGTITSVGREYVFVTYRGDMNSKATNPADLTFSHPAREKNR